MELKKLILLRFFNILICGMGLLFISTGVLFAYNLEEYYPLNEGNYWGYSLKKNDNGVETTDQSVNKIKGTEKFGEIETKQMLSSKLDSQCVVIDSEGVKLYKSWGWFGGDYELYNPPRILFPNMEVGETKTYQVEDVSYTIKDKPAENSRQKGTLTISLDSVENVDVPAGKFNDCLKFTSTYEYKFVNIKGSGKQILVTWLAQGIGEVKSDLTLAETYDMDEKNNIKESQVNESQLLELQEASVNGKSLPAAQELSTTKEVSPKVEEVKSPVTQELPATTEVSPKVEEVKSELPPVEAPPRAEESQNQ